MYYIHKRYDGLCIFCSKTHFSLKTRLVYLEGICSMLGFYNEHTLLVTSLFQFYEYCICRSPLATKGSHSVNTSKHRLSINHVFFLHLMWVALYYIQLNYTTKGSYVFRYLTGEINMLTTVYWHEYRRCRYRQMK